MYIHFCSVPACRSSRWGSRIGSSARLVVPRGRGLWRVTCSASGSRCVLGPSSTLDPSLYTMVPPPDRSDVSIDDFARLKSAPINARRLPEKTSVVHRRDKRRTMIEVQGNQTFKSVEGLHPFSQVWTRIQICSIPQRTIFRKC